MKTRILSYAEKAMTGADMMVSLDYSDVAALGAATNGAAINILADLPAGHKVQVVGMKLATEFDCSGTGNLTLSVGYSGAETALLAATQLATDTGVVAYSVGTGTNYVPVAEADINAYFDSTGVNLNTYTSGNVVVYLRVEDMNQWPIPA